MRVKSFIDEGRNKINYQGKQLLTVRNLSDDLLRIFVFGCCKNAKNAQSGIYIGKVLFCAKTQQS